MVYGYIRVSTDNQDVNNQKVGINKKAADIGLQIVDWISDEGVSGTKEPEKRELGKLLKKIKKGDVIISSEISRLGRSLFMVMRILEHCMKNDVRVYTVKDNYELGNNITSKVLAFAFGLAAEIEREMISKRTIEALQKKKDEGMILGRPKGRRSANKCEALRDKIIKYNELGLSVIGIARKIKVHRHTLTMWMKENGIDGNHAKFGCGKEPILPQYKYDIKSYLGDGLTYQQVLLRLKSEHALKCSILTLRTYINGDQELYQQYVQKQDELRIVANGGLKINTRH